MAVYIFNLLVGYLPNGVDNAQGYRAHMLNDFSDSIKYIFTEMPTREYINRYKKVGIKINQMLSVHQYFTDNCTLEISTKTKDKLEELRKSINYTDIRYTNQEIKLLRNGSVIASVLLEENGDSFYGICYFKEGRLIRMENYNSGISFVEYYITEKSDEKSYAKTVRRTFYNKDGSVAYDQIFQGELEWYVIFSDGKLCTKSQFIAEFIKKLNLEEQDIILLDRSAQFNFVQPLFQFGGKAQFISVLHSGHYFEKNEDTNTLYLNYEYYYWFKNSDKIDVMVVSTQEQKIELAEKLQEYNCSVPKIEVIPAGGIDYLRYPVEERKPYSLVTVSRLDERKKIDWIIKSVINAHQVNPDISIDIYGRGSNEYTQYLRDIVSSNHAQSYIRFMGYVNVTEIYKNYEVFVTASLWETLGLSLMEAAASGLALIGLDVKYGNHLFIKPGKNGCLVDFNTDYVIKDDEKLINAFAEKIVEIFSDEERLKEFHNNSYEIAKNFSSEIIAKKWKNLLFPDNSR